jgi:hypothetical protein
MADPSPFGETSFRAMVRAICDADPANVCGGGCVESVLTLLTQRSRDRFLAMTCFCYGVTITDGDVDSQYHPSQRVFSIQSPVRLSGFPHGIVRRDGHANPAVTEVTIQLVKFARIRDRIEGT